MSPDLDDDVEQQKEKDAAREAAGVLDGMSTRSQERFASLRQILSFDEYFREVVKSPHLHVRNAAMYMRDTFDAYGVDTVRGLRGPTRRFRLFDAITTDARFRMNATKVALNYRTFPQDAFVYLFSWESPARRGAVGSCHALEMPFVFGTLWAPTQDRFAGSGPEAEALSRRMMDAWIAFARGGNPSHEGIGDWPAYDEAARQTMVFDRETRLESDPFAEEREAITSLV